MNELMNQQAPVNHLMNFYHNTDEEKYQHFFKADETGSVAACTAKVKAALTTLESAKSELEEEYAKMYSHNYQPVNQVNIFQYNGRTGVGNAYDITGVQVNLQSYNEGEYTLRSLDTKHGEITMLDGYCYDLASFVLKTYKYNISGDNSKCTFTLINELLVPFFEDAVYTRAGRRLGGYNYGISGVLREYNSSEFINTFYNLERHYNYNLDTMRDIQERNPAFEVIIKTAPDSLMDDLLQMRDIEKSQPIYKILDITPDIYNVLLEKKIEVQYVSLRPFIKQKDVFHKTEMEWIDMIEEMKQKEDDLRFFHIEFEGYYYRSYKDCQLLGFLAENYSKSELLRKYYSFGKFCDYVIEETINQGFSEVRLFVTELIDYLRMCRDQNIVPTLYSSYLQQTHDIAKRNHKVYLDTMQEEIFAKRYEGFKTVKVGKEEDEYQVLAPTKSDDVKHEGDALNHCCASYIKRILDGTTQIFFLRKDPLVSLITLEVREGKICQARGMHNRKPTNEENKAIEEFAKKSKLEYTAY